MDNQQDKSKYVYPADGSEPYKRLVLDHDDIVSLAPWFKGRDKLIDRLFKLLWIDKVNWIHDHNADTPGVGFVEGLLRDRNATVEVHGEDVLDNLPPGGFITVSNHPFGALDGMILIKLVGERRPDFKVMVNMILKHVGALRDTFFAVDALASDDPAKRAVSMRGIAQSLNHVRKGHPLGFFPAGAVSKITPKLRIEDRDWQPNIMRLIQKLKVPVVPIYFHGHNSLWFNILGLIDWRLRTLRLPCEVFHRKNPVYRVSVGKPIPPEVYLEQQSPEELAKFLKAKTYEIKKWKKD